jgi:hypothetical protein
MHVALTKLCNSFSIVASVCKGDPGMSGMGGCEPFNALCATGSLVTQCQQEGVFPNIMGTMQAMGEVRRQCAARANLPGCRFLEGAHCSDPFQALTLNCALTSIHCESFNKMCGPKATKGSPVIQRVCSAYA